MSASKAVPAAWLFREVMARFAAFATAHLQERCCPRGDSFKAHFERLLTKAPLSRFYAKCVSGGGCFGRARSAPPCGGPGEFHYGNPSARERADLQKTVMATVAAFLGEAEDIMRLHADQPGGDFAKAAAEFERFVSPDLKAKAAVIRQQFGA